MDEARAAQRSPRSPLVTHKRIKHMYGTSWGSTRCQPYQCPHGEQAWASQPDFAAVYASFFPSVPHARKPTEVRSPEASPWLAIMHVLA